MTFWAILILLLVVAGLVAYVGDAVAKRVGKWHWRLFGLRPRTTGTIVAVATGMLIALGGFGAFFLVVRDARETILQAEQVRQERNRLQVEVERLENRAASTFQENERLKTEREEFVRNVEQQAKQLESNVALQKQTRQDLEKALIEREKLAQEVERLSKASTDQRLALQRLEQSRQALVLEKDQLQANRNQLLGDRNQLTERANRAQQQLTALEAASRNALSRFSQLQAREQALQTRTLQLQQQTQDLQTRSQTLQARLRDLESEKRNLEGDVSVLIAGQNNPQAISAPNPLRDQLEASRRENLQLRSNLQSLQRDLQQIRDRGRLLVASLDKALSSSLLSENAVSPGFEQESLVELLRRAESRARLIGLRGLEVGESPRPPEQIGLLMARIESISPEGKARVRIEYRAREQLFGSGEVVASMSMAMPLSNLEMQRRLENLDQQALERLSQAGWVPEKLEQGGIPLQEFISLANQLEGKRGVIKVSVVALENLYPTEAPRLGLRLLP